MTLILKQEPKNSSYTLPSKGFSRAVLYATEDLGIVETPFGDKHRCRLHFEVNERDTVGKRLFISKTYNVSLSEKSTLRKELELWRGVKFNADDLQAGINLEKLIGLNATIVVTHRETPDRVYANIENILPPQRNDKGKTDWYGLKPERSLR